MNKQHNTLPNNRKSDQANDKKVGSLAAPFCFFAPVVDQRANNSNTLLKR